MKTEINNEELVTKQLILESARKNFLEYGYQAAPLRKIASEAGYTHGALYGYFSSKEELFYAITDPVAEQLMEMLDKIQKKMQNIPKEKRLHEMGSIYYENIPKIVDILISDRDAVELIINGAKGTKYEEFLDNIARRNATDTPSTAACGGPTTTCPTSWRACAPGRGPAPVATGLAPPMAECTSKP